MKEYIVVAEQGELTPSGQTVKKNVVLGSLDTYEKDGTLRNAQLVTMLGDAAQKNYYRGALVIADVQTSVRSYEGRMYNDVVCSRTIIVSKEA